MAQYIVTKYIRPAKVEYPRDAVLAYKLIKRYPSFEFWRSLPVKHQVATMAILYCPKSKTRLDVQYKLFNEKRDIQRSIVIPEKLPTIVLGEKNGEDRVFIKKKKSILEFCR